MSEQPPIKMYAIYERPIDYPDGYMVRQWFIGAGTVMPGDSDRAATLEQARTHLPPGAEKTEWPGEPDPKIIETWM